MTKMICSLLGLCLLLSGCAVSTTARLAGDVVEGSAKTGLMVGKTTGKLAIKTGRVVTPGGSPHD